MDANVRAKIKRIDKNLPLPIYHTGGSVGFDILCREDTVVRAKEVVLIPGNVIVKTPEGYMLLVALRSSTPRRLGLIKPHGIGVIDNDYCGEEDEIKVQVYNITDKDVVVKRGDRIAQGIFVKVDRFEWEEVDKMGVSRGGYGSTG